MICDTGALLASLAVDQSHHDECLSVILESSSRLVPALVLAEIDRLIRRHVGGPAADRVVGELTGPAYQVLPLTRETMATATQVMSTTDLGLVDATLVAHAKETRTLDIFTLDRQHFRTVRALNGLPFRLLPFDLDL
jgi:predicted nucleic acid-binding protein